MRIVQNGQAAVQPMCQRAPGATPHAANGFADEMEVDGRRVPANLFHQIPDLFTGPFDLGQIEQRLLLASEFLLQQFDRDLQSLQCIAAFVSQPGHRLPDGCQTFALHELALGLDKVGHVQAHAEHGCGFAGSIAECRVGPANLAFLPVFGEDGIDDPTGFELDDGPVEHLADTFSIALEV